MPDSVAVVLFVRRTLTTVFVAFVVWLMAAVQLFFNVPAPAAARTEAVIMLGGASTERLPVAQQLRESLGIPVLVISHTSTPGNASADALCEDASRTDLTLLCLGLDEQDTRGEARAIGSLVAAKGWTSISVVTSRYHLTRAGMLIRQCTTADVRLIGSNPDFNLKQWMDRFVVETGGLLDATFRPECGT
ncbi:YdcF family protein [Arthrobacter rhizosphaerae]|uniref:YdcF family protein n=1 Tax=Arthrobacter rhizosphaerae TaxID=2855490 RepID=UPI001FF64F2D|nr:ElyC/SanA/YdcF family protein [Arthrobacter rhizosphaerae]